MSNHVMPDQGSHSGMQKSPSSLTAENADKRILALDGVRGAMTIMVVLSHYFAEVPHGFHILAFGWIAVTMFFVLSGFLVGRLIIDKKHHENFVKVFYVRRACRTLPVYMFCVVLVFALTQYFEGAVWMTSEETYPLWSYLTFNQNFFFVGHGNFGAPWLAPTWTLTVEEQFYLLVPLAFLWLPQRYWLRFFVSAIALVIAFRAAVFGGGMLPQLAGLCLLPSVADSLICGLIAAILYKNSNIDWKRHALLLRASPIAALLLALALKYADGDGAFLFSTFENLVIGIGCAMYLLGIVTGVPEAKRLESKFFCFFGHNSYSIYLTHLTTLGLLHGLILGTKPDVATPAQIAVTITAVGVCVVVGRVFTKFVEEPITAYGRSWKWGSNRPSDVSAQKPQLSASAA